MQQALRVSTSLCLQGEVAQELRHCAAICHGRSHRSSRSVAGAPCSSSLNQGVF